MSMPTSSRLRTLLLAFFLGGLGGALCDQIHVRFGVLGYPHATFAGQPLWVAPNFGLGTVLILLLCWSPPFADALPRRPTARDFVTGAFWFLGAYLASGLWFREPHWLSLAYALTWAGRMFLAGHGSTAVLFSVLLAIGGVTYEALLSATGAFHYTLPDRFGVPMWLAGIYLHGGPLALRVGRAAGGGA